jgi:hypothetical protein
MDKIRKNNFFISFFPSLPSLTDWFVASFIGPGPCRAVAPASGSLGPAHAFYGYGLSAAVQQRPRRASTQVHDNGVI